MCGKCEGCRSLLRVALAARDVAHAQRRDMSVFVVDLNTMISPTRSTDVPGKDFCFVVVTSSMSDEDVTTHVNEAFARSATADPVLDILSKLAAAFASADNN